MIRGLAFVLLGIALVLTVAVADFDQGVAYLFYWIIGGGLILYGARAMTKWRSQKRLIIRNYRFCAKCGYDVRASKDVCSECGWPIGKEWK